MSFGTRLKSLRNEHKMTQQQLGDKIHVTKVSISGYENGTRFPDTDTLKKIADYFNVSTDYLLDRDNQKNEYWELNEKDEKDIQKTLEDMMDGLSNDDSLAFMKNGGEELDDDDADLLRASLEQTIALSKQLAKKKFTRKDLRDKDK